MKKYIFLKESDYIPSIEQNFYGTLSESYGCTLSHYARVNSVAKIGKVQLQDGQTEYRIVQSYKSLASSDVYSVIDFGQLVKCIDTYEYVFVGAESDPSEVFSDVTLIQSLKLLTYKDGCLYDITNQTSLSGKTHIISLMCATKMNNKNAYMVVFNSMLSFDCIEYDAESLNDDTVLIYSDGSNTLRSKILDIVLSDGCIGLGHNKITTSPQILLVSNKQPEIFIDLFGPASVFHEDVDTIAGFTVNVVASCACAVNAGKIKLIDVNSGNIGYVKIQVIGSELFSQTVTDNIHESLTTEFLIISQ